MTGIESLYRKEDGRVLIEIKLSSIVQLYNSFEVAERVAMREPVTVYLYQLRTIISQKNLYEKISRMETDVRPYPEPEHS